MKLEDGVLRHGRFYCCRIFDSSSVCTYFGLLCGSIVYFDVVGCLSVSEIILLDFDVLNALVDMTMVYVSSLLFFRAPATLSYDDFPTW